MHKSAAMQLQNHIENIPRGEPFTASSLRHFANAENIRQILTRLTKSNFIKRVARGVFVRPEKISYLKETHPAAEQIAEAIAKSSGEIIAIHGAEAARRLQLTTQVPLKIIFYTTGNTRHIKTGKLTITLKHISPRKIVAAGTITGVVISALWYLGKNNISSKTIHKIKNQLTYEQYNEVLNATRYMPGWMANAFYRYKIENKNA